MATGHGGNTTYLDYEDVKNEGIMMKIREVGSWWDSG